MISGKNTTQIILDRGSEDVQLLAELHKITAATGIKGQFEFVKEYPMIHELKHNLTQEKEES